MNKVLLDHGSGGGLSQNFIKNLFLSVFDSPILGKLDDGAKIDFDCTRVAFSTDTYVVDPIFFPGGSIGDLAINGTVNDISMCGAKPLFLSVGFIIEEGFSIEDLRRIVDDMGCAAKKANVDIVTGDTKVVPKGAADKIFINTSGIGVIPRNVNVSGSFAKPGDVIILSGTMADHGIAVLIQRQGLRFESNIISDTAPLNQMVQGMLSKNKSVHALRDPTRGGVATSLNEIAEKSGVGIKIFENNLPIKDDVLGVCEFLGFDPVYIANEGKLLAFVPKDCADQILSSIKDDCYGKDACIIGEVVSDHPGQVFMRTSIGGERIVDMLTGEQLPRIC